MLLGDQEEAASSKRAPLKEMNSLENGNDAWEEGAFKRSRQENTFIHFVLIIFLSMAKLHQIYSLGSFGALRSLAPSAVMSSSSQQSFFFPEIYFLFICVSGCVLKNMSE